MSYSDSHCKVCGTEIPGDTGYAFVKGWWYCLEHAPAPDGECPDCRKRVASLWALVADEEMQTDELPAEWEQRCSRHALNAVSEVFEPEES